MAKRKRKRSSRKWISKAIRHPGALRRQLRVAKGRKIPVSKLRKAAKSRGVLGRRARLAQTLRRISSHRRKRR